MKVDHNTIWLEHGRIEVCIETEGQAYATYEVLSFDVYINTSCEWEGFKNLEDAYKYYLEQTSEGI